MVLGATFLMGEPSSLKPGGPVNSTMATNFSSFCVEEAHLLQMHVCTQVHEHAFGLAVAMPKVDTLSDPKAS